ncbi:MAG: BlaI/MecI/CopY family transcriptional regulator [Myxococcales bacterium]|nr:BlaI/MecI/CopY family transcriptional regulator [Myxococcales bacterium]
MDIVYRLGSATVQQVLDELQDPPSYSAVRALLATLERKGALRKEQDGPRYRYLPTQPRDVAAQSALKRVIDAFFAGSAAEAALQLLRMSDSLSPEEIEALQAEIVDAEEDGR